MIWRPRLNPCPARSPCSTRPSGISPAQLAVLTATVDRLADENRAVRAELAATQRQLLQIAWGLVAALLGATAAVIGALL